MYAGHARTCNPARNTIRDRFDSYGWRGVSSSLPTLPSPSSRRETVSRSIFGAITRVGINIISLLLLLLYSRFKKEKERVFN